VPVLCRLIRFLELVKIPDKHSDALAGTFMAVFEPDLGDAEFVEIAKAFDDHAIVLFICGARAVDRDQIARELRPKIVGDFIAAHSTPVALREGVLYVRVLQPALHYELEQISKIEILRKLKQRFGAKTIRDIRFRVG
jgi:Dna[CI] antecedent DciA-like protein